MQVTPQVVRLLQILDKPYGRRELQEKFGLRDREHFRKFGHDGVMATTWYLVITLGWQSLSSPRRHSAVFKRESTVFSGG